MSPRQYNQLSVVIPTLNEKDNIKPLVTRLDLSLRRAGIAYELVFIDDHSTDGTRAEIQKLASSYPVVLSLKRGARGKAQSLLEGFALARYELVAMIDADLQYPPEALPAMVDKLNGSHDIVVAHRSIHREGGLRRVISKVFHLFFIQLLHGFDLDTQSGLKVFKRQILREVELHPGPWSFDLEFLLKARHAGHRIGAHDIIFEKRHAGVSKINLLTASVEIGLHALKLKFQNLSPVHIPPPAGRGMEGAGVAHRFRRFITHSTLPHHLSALLTFSFWQKALLVAALAALAAGLYLAPFRTAIVITAILSAIYFLDALFNLWLVLRSLKSPPEMKFAEAELRAINESTLPVYTILCPLYRESRVLPHFLKALDRLSWPKDKLDVILLLEEDDAETLRALSAHPLPDYVRVLTVPHSFPKTKPKACNYGLAYAKGEYLVIYDAEDQPDLWQLKKAYLGFGRVAPNVRCLQAKLNYYNPHQNFLTRLFTAEYSLWFDVVLTGIQTIDAIVPLGGTSNHFRTRDLRQLHGWDPFNVTEDCDLGARLFKRGYKTAIIDSTTYEEANSDVKNWLRQRSRWIKGYMQTYLVHMRRPFAFFRESGVQAGLFQLIVGGKIAFVLINPFLWLLTVAYFALYAAVGPAIEAIYPTVVFYMAATSLVFGNFLFLYYYMIGCAKRGHWTLVKYVFLVPVYWLLTSVAAFVALYQLFMRPHHWEKTHHGLHLAPPKTEFKAADASPFSVRLLEVFRKVLPERFSSRILSGAGLLVGAMLVSNFVNFLFNAFLGRALGFAELGIVTLVNTLLALAALFFTALSSTVNHRTAYLSASRGVERALRFRRDVKRKSLTAALVLSGLWFVLVPMFTRFFNLPDQLTLFLFTPILLLGTLAALNRGFLHGTLNFASVGVLFLAEAISKLILAVVLAIAGFESWVYLAIPVSVVFAAWLSERLVVRKTGAFAAAGTIHRRQIFPSRFFAASLLTGVSAILFLNFDLVLVKHFLSPSMAGEYALLSLVGKMIYFFGSLPVIFMITFVSRAEGLSKNPRRVLRAIFGTTIALTGIAYALLAPFGDRTVPLLLGPKALTILPYLNIYALGIVCFTLASVLVTYHLARRQYIFPITSALAAGIMAVGIAISHEGIYEITHVIFGAGAIGLGSVVLLHLFEDKLKYLKRAFSDSLGVFLPLPQGRTVAADKKRILIFNWRDTRHQFAGGAEVYIQEMAKRWIRDGHGVTVFCGNDGLCPRSEMVDGIEIVRRGGFYLVYFWAVIYYLLRFRGRYDVVIDCQNGVPFFTPLYVREPVFCVMHHVHQEIFRRYLAKPLALFAAFLEKQLMPLVYQNTKFITVSDSTKKAMEDLGLKGTGIEIVHNGVDLEKHRPAEKSREPLILYVGRLKPYKSLDVLIRAFAFVKDEVPDAKLVIAGSGEQASWLKQFVRDLHLTGRVLFKGRVSDEEKISLMQKAWVFVNPSLIEGWGITTVEANACATPVIASDVPGLRDSVQNPHTGILVPYGNSQALAEKITLIIRDRKLREEMGREAVEWARRFDWRKTSQDFLAVIGHLDYALKDEAYEQERF